MRTGRPSKLTLADVETVAREIAKGVPVELAIAYKLPCERQVDKVNWYKAINRNPIFRHAHAHLCGEFVSQSIDLINSEMGGKVYSGRQFVLERRYREDFGREPDRNSVAVNVQVNGVHADLMSSMRQLAKERVKSGSKRIADKPKVEKIVDVQAVKVESEPVVQVAVHSPKAKKVKPPFRACPGCPACAAGDLENCEVLKAQRAG